MLKLNIITFARSHRSSQTSDKTVFAVTFSSSTKTMLCCVALAAGCFMRSETNVRFFDWVWQKCSGDSPGKGRALGTWSDRINGKQLDDKSVTVRRPRPFPADGRESDRVREINCLMSETWAYTLFTRVLMKQCRAVFMRLWLCALPNTYCHKDAR